MLPDDKKKKKKKNSKILIKVPSAGLIKFLVVNSTGHMEQKGIQL
jgi:hypothetical protein